MLVERTPGAFYLKSKAFLHFHEDPSGIYADVKLDSTRFTRMRVTSAHEQANFVKSVRRCLCPGKGNDNSEALEQHLRELEESLLQPEVRKSRTLAELLDDDFIEFGSSGRIYTKSDLAATLQRESPSKQTASDFKLTKLSPDAALLTYRIYLHRDPPVSTLRSSIWRRTDGIWRMMFHQATIIK